MYSVYLAMTIELIAGSNVESNEPTAVGDYWGKREIFRGILSFQVLCSHLLVAEEDTKDEGTELISDLPLASFDESIDHKSLCPHHGQTCKKGLCEWRAAYEKQKERECGYPKGPSNIKNYNPRPYNKKYRGSPPNGGSRDGTPTDVRGSARGRGIPAPRGNAWGRGLPTAPSRVNQPSTSTPGQGNGIGRGGQPAWAPARGRKPI